MDYLTGKLNHHRRRIFKQKHVSRQSYSSRAINLPEKFYKEVCCEICQLLDKMYICNQVNTKYGSYDICAVDGSDTNHSKLLKNDGFKTNKNNNTVAALNMCIYNVTRNYPVTIQMVTHNNERRAFLDLVNNRKDFTNTIFVFDMGFDGFEFFEKLENLGLKYVCRIKSNSTLITNLNDSVQTYKDDCQTRVVVYNINKKSYYLATNLFDCVEFTINILKQLYHERWTIEEIFKYMKENFAFGTSELKSASSVRKSIYCQIVIMRLINILSFNGIKKFKHVKKNRIVNLKI